jgi:hypothetical protein
MKKHMISLFLVLFAIPMYGQQKPLTNADVLTMVKSGLSSEIVVAKIKSSTCAFDTAPKTLADLKTSGVPNAVILAVVQCPTAENETSGENSAAPRKAPTAQVKCGPRDVDRLLFKQPETIDTTAKIPCGEQVEIMSYVGKNRVYEVRRGTGQTGYVLEDVIGPPASKAPTKQADSPKTHALDDNCSKYVSNSGDLTAYNKCLIENGRQPIVGSSNSSPNPGADSSTPHGPTSGAETSRVPASTPPVSMAMPRALRAEAYTSDVSAGLPAEWHLQLNQQETAWASQIIKVLKGVPDFPKVTGFAIPPGVPPQMQINAWEQGMKITIPVEMVRFLEDDPNAFAFLVAHEAGHAKQEEIYGQSCYTANNVAMSKFDWVRTLADVAGGAATSGAQGAAAATVNIQKQACEDNADTWAVHFMRQGGGADPTGGLRLFSRLRQFSGFAGWKSLTEQFTATHSIDEVRIAHISALLLRK